MSFLKSLKEIRSKHGKINRNVVLNIHDNYEMRRLGLDNLEELYDVLFGPFFINLENLHPEFCLTFEELLLFYEQRVLFNNIHAKYCPESKKKINGQKLCEIRSLDTLDSDCDYLLGDLVIDSYEDSHPAILVRSNKYLKQLKLPNLKHVISRHKDAVVIEDNPVLFSSNMECLMYRITYATNLRIKNEACGEFGSYSTGQKVINFGCVQ